MTPDVDTFIVNHKQTSEYLTRGVEVKTISMGYTVIVFHVVRSSLIVDYHRRTWLASDPHFLLGCLRATFLQVFFLTIRPFLCCHDKI